MFKAKQKEFTKLDKEINNLIGTLECMEGDSEQYKIASENLLTLYKAKSLEAEINAKEDNILKYISLDTLVNGSISLVEILCILNYEKLDAITSKALNFILKPKI